LRLWLGKTNILPEVDRWRVGKRLWLADIDNIPSEEERQERVSIRDYSKEKIIRYLLKQKGMRGSV
jgi:hypothetical protein